MAAGDKIKETEKGMNVTAMLTRVQELERKQKELRKKMELWAERTGYTGLDVEAEDPEEKKDLEQIKENNAAIKAGKFKTLDKVKKKKLTKEEKRKDNIAENKRMRYLTG